MHPNTAAILKFFEYEHLPTELRAVSAPFASLAHLLAEGVPLSNNTYRNLEGPELTMALRKLLEAKDCAVRAAL